jgi:hypothetical protein
MQQNEIEIADIINSCDHYKTGIFASRYLKNENLEIITDEAQNLISLRFFRQINMSGSKRLIEKTIGSMELILFVLRLRSVTTNYMSSQYLPVCRQ